MTSTSPKQPPRRPLFGQLRDVPDENRDLESSPAGVVSTMSSTARASLQCWQARWDDLVQSCDGTLPTGHELWSQLPVELIVPEGSMPRLPDFVQAWGLGPEMLAKFKRWQQLALALRKLVASSEMQVWRASKDPGYEDFVESMLNLVSMSGEIVDVELQALAWAQADNRSFEKVQSLYGGAELGFLPVPLPEPTSWEHVALRVLLIHGAQESLHKAQVELLRSRFNNNFKSASPEDWVRIPLVSGRFHAFAAMVMTRSVQLLEHPAAEQLLVVGLESQRRTLESLAEASGEYVKAATASMKRAQERRERLFASPPRPPAYEAAEKSGWASLFDDETSLKEVPVIPGIHDNTQQSTTI